MRKRTAQQVHSNIEIYVWRANVDKFVKTLENYLNVWEIDLNARDFLSERLGSDQQREKPF